jgi:hypothetical protein
MIVAHNEEIQFWYEHCINQQDSSLGVVNYAIKHKLHSKLLTNWKQRFNPWHSKYKTDKERELELTRLYLATNPPRSYFCSKNGLLIHRLSIVMSHLGYMEKLHEIYGEVIPESFLVEKINIEVPVEEYMDIPEQEPMKFITRAPEPTHLPVHHAPEAEIIEERNPIELTITKGVKVIVSPELCPTKIIKIIELLKDL